MPTIKDLTNITLEEERANLIKIYDVFNDIAKALFEKQIDVGDCFYTKEEYENEKKIKTNI